MLSASIRRETEVDASVGKLIHNTDGRVVAKCSMTIDYICQLDNEKRRK